MRNELIPPEQNRGQRETTNSFLSDNAPIPEAADPVAQEPPTTVPRQRFFLFGRLRSVQDVQDVVAMAHPDAIPMLAVALGHRHFAVRQAAAAALRGYGKPGFEAVLKALGSGSARARQAAAECLGEWGNQEAVPWLLEALKKTREGNSIGCTLGCLAALFFFWLGVLVWLLSAMGLFSPRNRNDLKISIVRALGRLGDTRAVADLARFANFERLNDPVANVTEETLHRLLTMVHEMTPEQADLLGTDAIQALADLLPNSSSFLYEKEVLLALKAVGDQRAIPAVQMLLRAKAPVEWKGLAAEVLHVLEERKAQEEARATLLRGSAAPSASPDELLRPAHGQPTVTDPPEQLLRASTSRVEGSEGS